MIDNSKEYILCAAVKRRKPVEGVSPYWIDTNDILDIELGYRHHDIIQKFGKDIIDTSPKAQGFYTSKGRFVDRYEGMRIAFEAGQVTEEVALSKKWLTEIKITFKPDSELKDNHKFNMLFSEHLY